MTLRVAAGFARRELRGGLSGFRVFLACLLLGVGAIAAVGTVRASIETGLAREGAALLGGDAELEFTYRRADADEQSWMSETAREVSEVIDFRSMAVTEAVEEAERALTQIKAVDGAYPLVGAVVLAPDITLDEALAGRDDLPGAVMERLLINRLDMTIGDRFRLGTQDFILMAELVSLPDNTTAGFTLGPRTIVASTALKTSGLLAAGSLFSAHYRLLLPAQTDLERLQQTAEAKFPNSGLRWRDSRNGAPGVSRFVDRIGAFLILVGLSGLAVGGVGVSSAVRSYLASKTSVIATLRTLGAERSLIFQTYFIQVGVLSLLGISAGLIFGAVTPIFLAPLIEASLPVPAEFTLYPAPLIEAGIYGLLTALIFTLWPLSRAGEVRAATLFRDSLGTAQKLPPRSILAITGGLIVVFLAAASWFSGSPRLTLWTTGGVIGALALLALVAWGVQIAARRLRRLALIRPTVRWALASIAGPKSDAASVVLSLGLGLSVLAAVGQIDGNLRGAIDRDLPEVAPAYFFIDIQRDQMPDFLARLEGDPGVSRVQSAPMMRGVLTHINGRPAEDVAGDHWVVRGDRGITYADALPDGTRITAGKWWGAGYDGPPQVSFAREEAEELGLGLGDEITLNILGRDITAEITSLREVDFSSGGMGFVLTLNEAAVAGAPHSFIATVYADAEAEALILRDISTQMPNVTAVRVRDAIDRVSELLAGLAAATSYGAAITLLTGFLVLIGAAAAGQPARTYEAAVLKTLGASRSQILASFVLRSCLLGAAAGGVALAAGIAGGWAVSHFVMDSSFQVMWPSAVMIVLGGILTTLLAGIAFAWRPLAARPAQVLRARE